MFNIQAIHIVYTDSISIIFGLFRDQETKEQLVNMLAPLNLNNLGRNFPNSSGRGSLPSSEPGQLDLWGDQLPLSRIENIRDVVTQNSDDVMDRTVVTPMRIRL